MSIDLTNDNKTFNKLYMAIATKIIAPFDGNESQDINNWLRDFKLITLAGGLSSVDKSRTLICCLRGNALSWASSFMDKTPSIDFDRLCAAIESRFASKRNISKILQKIFTLPQVKSIEELNQLIRDANYLHEKQYLLTEAICDAVIPKLLDHVYFPTRKVRKYTRKHIHLFLSFKEIFVLPL